LNEEPKSCAGGICRQDSGRGSVALFLKQKKSTGAFAAHRLTKVFAKPKL
jgi:hypothetical protein